MSAETLVPLFQCLDSSPRDATGAWTFGNTSGPEGLVLMERGRICWAASRQRQRRLTDLLEARIGIPPGEVVRVLTQCRREGEPIGESLVRAGLVSPEQFQEVLRQDTWESLWRMAQDARGQEARFTPHRGQGYSPQFTFSVQEAFAGAACLALELTPAAAVSRLGHGRWLCSRGKWALFTRESSGGVLPVAVAGKEFSDVEELMLLGGWAVDALGSAARLRPPGTFVSAFFGPGGTGAWWEDGYVAAVLFEREVELNRLLALRGRGGPTGSP